jgi:hypothetical protein
MFAGYLRPSLRRRVAVALAAIFVLGYVVGAAALNVAEVYARAETGRDEGVAEHLRVRPAATTAKSS